nr:hypothetical protein [Tanacetum cinerariifolium]
MEFNADDYATLVARPAPFRKFSEPFLCLIGMSRNYTLDEDNFPTFLHDDGTGGCLPTYIVQLVADHTKVKVRERECAEGEARLLGSTIGHVVPLLPVASAHAKSEFEASVERLFDEGGNADQVDSTAGGDQEAGVGIATGVRIVAKENVAAERPRRPRKKRQFITGVGGSSRPPKKLRGTTELLVRLLFVVNLRPPLGSCWQAACRMLKSVLQPCQLLMVTSSVSVTPEHESDAPVDSINGLNVHTIGASERFVISSDSSHHSSTHASEAEVDSIIRSDIVPLVMTEVVVTSHAVDIPPVSEMGVKVTSHVRASLFQDSDSTETVKDDIAGPSYFARKDLSMGSRELNSETLHQSLMWVPPRQACLNAEVRMRTEYCLSEKKRLQSECEKQADLLKVTEKSHASEIDALKQKNVGLVNEKESLDEKVAELQSLVSSKDLKLKELNVVVSSLRSQKDGLVSQVHELEVTCSSLCERLSGYENLIDRLEEFQDVQLKVVNDKVAKLDADLADMACHLEKKLYPHLLTTISGQRWLLTHGLKLVLVKCLNSSEYLTALGDAIIRSIRKGMQDGLAARIDHGREGRNLIDVAAYNPSVETNINYVLQELCELDYPLLAELKSHKDTSVEDI